jgi:peptide/nickel transport system substrate-binding protein
MKHLRLRLLAISCLLLAAVCGQASSRPRYGGTARVLLHDRVNTLDPAADDDHPAARDRLAAMTFETLTAVDGQGRVQARLASSWHSDSSKRVWQFRLRLANFHDGTAITAASVAASLKAVSPDWRYTADDRKTLTIETPSPVHHLPEMLALEKLAIVKRQSDGTLMGTGPYRVTAWQPGERALFTANDDYWGGRPYPDSIEFQMGAGLREQLLQRQLGPYAAAELTLDGLRALEQSGQSISSSRPADLLAVVFLQPDSAGLAGRQRKAVDPRVRQALALSLNRAAISNVLLQRRGTPASGLLPQWLTGYEFLLEGAQDADRARKLVAGVGPVTPATPIALAYDFSDATAKLIAERIAVDAREVGIKVQPYGEAHVNSKSAQASLSADAVLLRLPLLSLEPSVALAALAGDLGLDAQSISAALSAGRPEDLFEVERKALENSRVIPVAHVSQAVWLNGSTHNWQQLPTGAWDLDQLWVEGAR